MSIPPVNVCCGQDGRDLGGLRIWFRSDLARGLPGFVIPVAPQP